jgi:hypothetical protein
MLTREGRSLHCLGFLAQFGDDAPNAEEEEVNDDYLFLVSCNLEEWESN